MVTERIDVRFIGRLWMPMVEVPGELTIDVGPGPFHVSFDNPLDPEEIEGYIDTHTGDYSAVDVVDILYTRKETRQSLPVRIDPATSEIETHTVTRVVEVVAADPDKDEKWCSLFPDGE